MKYFKKSYYQRKYESFLKRFFPEKHKWLLVKKDYEYATSKKLDWKDPKDINQKLLWLMRYWQNPLIITCADKYKVRDYIRDKGLEEILVPLIGVYDNADEIDFDSLPNQFVLKCNHGSGTNIICRDKREINIDVVKRGLSDWLSGDYGGGTNEFYYSKIAPRIICETYLDNDGMSLIDYKLHCINGEPQFFLVCSERDIENSKLTLTSYTKKWDKKDYLKTEGNQIQKPKELDKIIEYAKILSKDFPYVRADFYEVDGKVYFGELTFTPAANNMYYYKDSVLEMMGEKLVLPTEKIERNW